MKQGTKEWHEARRAKITGTGFAKVLSKRGNTRKDYMRQLILERKTGVSTETFTNDAMEWGTLNEPKARAYYEKGYNVQVTEVGFIDYRPKSEAERMEFGNYVGVSPDGLVGEDGIIEIKCPNTNTHMEYMAKCAGKPPAKYLAQIQGILWVTGRKWCDFISFDPRVEKQPFWRIRVQRDEEYIKNLKKEVSKFIDEMLKMQLEVEDVDPQLLIDVTGGSNEDDWLQAKQMEIRGKCRTLFVCAMAQGGKSMEFPGEKFKTDADYYNRVVNYMVTGE
jgi:putative phage-type endonuclease